MIPIQINGKTIFLTFEEWMSVTDSDYQDLIASDRGYEIDDPFNDKVLGNLDNLTTDQELPLDKIDNLPDLPELTEEELKKIENDIIKRGRKNS